ncbi:hypothetical protein OOK29_09715 [Streptomyces phaeochromogenes]|uniref:DUF6197 family protein n=1 Tax=Streptomyces phaeochromogenes TaxID=1923 RepID=UPI0022554777|nr:hypothetical protein [Streptomyces phaeochromogenes]MCX5598414.1 hypothetical protein [Streptomyces phaeochromogenes]
MTTHTPVRATPPVTAPVELDLEARLAIVDAIMAARIDRAGLAFDINTAYISAAPPVEIAAPLPLTPTAAPDPYTTPIAGTLQRARGRIMQDGWCRDAIFDEAGAICPIRAIRLEAASRGQADDACVFLLDVIRAELPSVETIPSWNSDQTSAAPVLRYLDRAADLAHARLI